MTRFLAILLFCAPVWAQISIYHQNTAGSANDIAARFIAQQLEPLVGQTIVVRNAPGADGLIAIREAEKDHNSLLVLTPNIAMWSGKPEGQTVKNFVPMQATFTYDMLLVVPTSSGVTDFAGFRQWAKTKQLNFASIGASSTKTAELLDAQLGTKSQPILYKDRAQVPIDLMNGLTDYTFFGAFNQQFLAGLQAGKLRVIASVDAKRATSFPESPSITEFGLKPLNTFIWAALAPHPAMPADTKVKVATALGKVMASPETDDFLRRTNQRRLDMSPADITRRMALESELLK